MAQSEVDACNSALQKVGAARILAITGNSREARECSVAFDSNRRDELRKYRWNFAKKRAVLAPDATAPAFDYDFQFTVPSGCLRVLLPKDNTLDWRVEGRKILTNYGSVTTSAGSTPQLNLLYIADIEDVTLWDPSFYNVFAISLAIDICEPLTQSNQKVARLEQDYKDAVRDARRANAFETLAADSPDGDWTIGRFNYANRYLGF